MCIFIVPLQSAKKYTGLYSTLSITVKTLINETKKTITPHALHLLHGFCTNYHGAG